MTIAQTIIDQLGNGKFIAMTGAHQFIDHGRGVAFRIGRNENKVTHVNVSLNFADLYDVEFINVRGVNVKRISAACMIDAAGLRSTFTSHTGMEISL